MIKQALSGLTPRQGLNHVIGPHPMDNTCWAESRTKTELEQICLAEAGRRFTPALQTPFLQSLLLELFMEANLSTKAFDQVLDRLFECPEGTDKMARCLLLALKCP